MQEYKKLKAQGMLADDGNILRYDEILKRDYSKKAEESHKKWSLWDNNLFHIPNNMIM